MKSKKRTYAFVNARGYYLQRFDEGISLYNNWLENAIKIIGTEEFAEGAKFMLEKFINEKLELHAINSGKRK